MIDYSLVAMRAPEDISERGIWACHVADSRFRGDAAMGVMWRMRSGSGHIFRLRLAKGVTTDIPAHRVMACKTSAQLIELLETEVAIETVRRAGQ